MSYLINEIFHSIQGEGVNTGRAAIFIRFSRCNLWTGREEDRAGAVCTFCDTDFRHADRMSLFDIRDRVIELRGGTYPMLVLTGGEPLLQADPLLINCLRDMGHYVAVETNGTQALPSAPLDWVCVSPKGNARLKLRYGDELKLVYPQRNARPEFYELLDFRVFWLSPMDGPNLTENTAAALDYVKAHPRWRLNVQTHKQIGAR